MNSKFVRSQDGCTMFRVCDIERVEIFYNDNVSIGDRLKNFVSGEHKEPENSWYEIMFFFDMNLGVEDDKAIMAIYSTEEIANDALTMYTRFLSTDNFHTFRFSSEEYVKEYFKE